MHLQALGGWAPLGLVLGSEAQGRVQVLEEEDQREGARQGQEVGVGLGRAGSVRSTLEQLT